MSVYLVHVQMDLLLIVLIFLEVSPADVSLGILETPAITTMSVKYSAHVKMEGGVIMFLMDIFVTARQIGQVKTVLYE